MDCLPTGRFTVRARMQSGGSIDIRAVSASTMRISAKRWRRGCRTNTATALRTSLYDKLLLLVADAAGTAAAQQFAARLGFVIACGNDDAHLKTGVSWVRRSGLLSAPCYDLVATVSGNSLVGTDGLATTVRASH